MGSITSNTYIAYLSQQCLVHQLRAHKKEVLLGLHMGLLFIAHASYGWLLMNTKLIHEDKQIDTIFA
jgi:hypothetical protein